jgi:hypothetical protein
MRVIEVEAGVDLEGLEEALGMLGLSIVDRPDGGVRIRRIPPYFEAARMTLLGRINAKRNYAAHWTSLNPILANGEMGVEMDTGKAKFGNGVTAWTSLPYAGRDEGAYVKVIPTTGFDVTLADGVGQYQMAPAGTLATGAIKMPANPFDGQTVRISTTAQVTALTVTANTGQTISNAISAAALAAGATAAWRYSVAETNWYRVQ